jgi:asparagine synthase (glutamine-hydrolysing)
MCGIVGIVDLEGTREIDRDLLSRMNESQHHRGPDEGGLHVEPGLGLGHRRLSIIDLATGQQPLFSADRSIVVTFNGEIYNFQAVRSELERLGCIFATHSDTEVIVYAWSAWGPACVERFNGMFAFAVWDRPKQTLFLARDRLGVKPLHYAMTADNHLVFGSELKSLLEHPRVSRVVDPPAVEDYFGYGYVPEPRTVFRDVWKLPPGHRMTVRRGDRSCRPEQYWDVGFHRNDAITEEAARAELVDRLREATRLRLISEVPLGAFLSGGVDSSAVVAMMAGLSADPVNTCSISFGDRDYDESRFAQQVAERYRTNHRVERVDPDDFSLVDRLAWLYDEPYADSSALPTYRVCELARRQVTVALSGDGGDESLAGYRRHRWHAYEDRVRSLLPLALRRPLFGFLGRVYPKLDWAPKVLRAKSTLQSLARDSVEGYFHSISVMGDPLRARLYSPAFKKSLGGHEAVDVMRRHAANAPTDHPLSLVQYLDLKTYLPGDILTKVDRASMAHALEVRSPFLDYQLVEWLATLPPDLKLRGSEGKYLLKKAMEPHLPHEIMYRPKMGFAVPLAGWFRGPLRTTLREALLGPRMLDSGYFDRRVLEQMVDDHQSGLSDHSPALWSLLMFEGFLKRAA